MAQIYPLQILVASLAGWMNRQQGEVLEYLIEEKRVLKEQLKGRALRLTDDQRRRLAAKGKRIGRRLLMQVATIVTPDTILRWHHRLIAAKWTYESKRVGRPGLMKEIRELTVRFARENRGWGYCRIEGALRNVGHRVALVHEPGAHTGLEGTRPRCRDRDRTVARVKGVGRRRWKKESGYHQQARVENAFFRYKSILGARVRARGERGRWQKPPLPATSRTG